MSTRDEFELKPISKPKPNSGKPKKQPKKKKKDNQRKERKATQTLAIVLGESALGMVLDGFECQRVVRLYIKGDSKEVNFGFLKKNYPNNRKDYTS